MVFHCFFDRLRGKAAGVTAWIRFPLRLLTLPRTVGTKMAMEIALLGDRFDAARALQLGLVNRVVPAAQRQEVAATLAARLAKGPTAVYGRTKKLINESHNHTLAEQLQAEQESFVASALGADFAEGIAAFVEKRKPNFVGR